MSLGLKRNGACDDDMNTTPPNTGEFGQRAAPPRLIVPKSANEALRPEAGTPPPRRSRQSRNQVVVFLNFLMTALVFGVVAGGVLPITASGSSRPRAGDQRHPS